jgi:hypothetical protein
MENPNIAPDAFPPQVEPKKNNTTLIIVIVVVVLLCCCCLIIGGGAWMFGDQIMKAINP